jgi:hypothetical protein
VIASHIIAAMKAQYPQANFAAYFAFLGRCRPRGKTQKHHIAPRSLWPELADDKQNLIPLTVPQHKKAHAILAKQIPDASWPCPKFIAAPGSPQWRAASHNAKWRAANRAAMRKLHASPAWRAATRAALRKLHASPAWRAANRAAMRKLAANPAWRAASHNAKWRAANRAANRRLSLTGRALPIKKILAMYRNGTNVVAIALAIGNPPNSGQNRIARALIKAGMYRGKR